MKDDTTIMAVDILPPQCEDFKRLRRAESRVFSCFSTNVETERLSMFYEMDSITMEPNASRRTTNEFLTKSLNTGGDARVTTDYTVHGKGKPAIFRLVKETDEE